MFAGVLIVMAKLLIHFDNYWQYHQPTLCVTQPDNPEKKTFTPVREDAYGLIYEVDVPAKSTLLFKFMDTASAEPKEEADSLWRVLDTKVYSKVREVWARSWNPFVYTAQPHIPDATPASEVAQQD